MTTGAAEQSHGSDDARTPGPSTDRFIANLSHELRTPLTPALLLISALQANPNLPGDVRADLALVREQIELEVRLIDDLLDRNQLARGKMRLRSEIVDLQAILERFIETMQSKHRAGPVISLQWLCGNRLVLGDSARLVQIFSKLLDNAVKFTPTDGSVNVTARQQGESISIEICDTGRGFDADAMPDLFDGSEKEQGLLRDAVAGLGVGLSIARGLARLHGGDISARSDGPGRGAVFTVILPAVPTPDTPHIATESAAGVASPARRVRRPLRVLLVEDHDQSLMATARLLKTMGHTVHTAGGMLTAQSALQAQHFDILVADIELPDGNGWQLMQSARGLGTPIGLALSGHGGDEHIRKSREAGFAAHLVKPITFQRLTNAIDEAVSLTPAES
jgi:CheY-like chemotaxis protein